MDGIIPFVCGAIKRSRRARSTTEYERLHSGGAATSLADPEQRFTTGAGPCRSQSCRFGVARSPPADELDPWRDDRAPPESSPGEPYSPARDGRGVSRSRRFGSMRPFACISGP